MTGNSLWWRALVFVAFSWIEKESVGEVWPRWQGEPLSCRPTRVPSEKVFSQAGVIVRPHYSCLESGSIEKPIFLKVNLPLLGCWGSAKFLLRKREWYHLLTVLGMLCFTLLPPDPASFTHPTAAPGLCSLNCAVTHSVGIVPTHHRLSAAPICLPVLPSAFAHSQCNLPSASSMLLAFPVGIPTVQN